MKDDPHAQMSKQWQYYLIAINYHMTLENIYLLLDDRLAFANGTGFRTLDSPTKKDYIFDRINFTDLPRLDKVRTCSYNTVTGVEQYSVVQSLKATANVLQGFLRAGKGTLADVRAAILTKVLNVKTFDSRLPPPLKPGKTYPNKVVDINPDDYLYLPQYNREMFLVANIVNRAGEVTQFPRGGLYNWTGDSTPYSFLPHISNYAYRSVLVPISRFRKLAVDAPVFRPYTT